MDFKIENCTNGDSNHIIDRLVECNLSQVSAEQEVLFNTLDKKITEDNGNTIAVCLEKMYCLDVKCIENREGRPLVQHGGFRDHRQ